jgi:hypothetical protein
MGTKPLDQTSDDELLSGVFGSEDPVVQELAKRLEQMNERMETLLSSAGCGSFPELVLFVERNSDDGR